jgi:hypothetical protein
LHTKFHTPEFLPDSYKFEPIHIDAGWHVGALGTYTLNFEDSDEPADPDFFIEPKQKANPNWQDRRQQSKDSKAALIAKMKKR